MTGSESPFAAVDSGSPLADSDHLWLGVALVVGSGVSAGYLLTHPYPAYGAGLYLHVAELIQSGGYRLPETVTLYPESPPFAYPPLAFYGAALVLDVTGVDPITYARVVPAVATVASLVPYYFVAREFTRTSRRAGVATAILATSPPVLQWHLSAGGIVRAPAFLLSLSGVYVGVRVHRYREWRLIPVGLVLFGLTLLAHPVYTAFFAVSWLLLYAYFDRTAPGLLAGATVAGGGLLLAAPWWTRVAAVHGPDVFLAAAGTHSGLGGGVHRLLDQFVYPLDPTVAALFFVAIYGGALWFVWERRYFLPLWLFTVAYVVGKERFQFVAGATMAAVALFEAVPPLADRWFGGAERASAATVLVVAMLVTTGVGGMYAASVLDSAHHGSTSQPSFIDADDRTAMRWAATETRPDAEFVVVGDAAEWFPLFADRAIVVGPWGVEWTTPQNYEHQLALYKNVSDCDTGRCLTRRLDDADVSPDYVYVPTDEYTVRGLERPASPTIREQLVASGRYTLVFENDGVAVFEVHGGGDAPSPAPDSRSVETSRELRTV